MKRIIWALIALLLLPSIACADERSYVFQLTAQGQDTCCAAPGDVVTVSLTLRRLSGTGPMYAMQDEIVFDPAFFSYQEDATLLRGGVRTSLVTLRDGRQAVYMNYLDFGAGADWAQETLIGSIQLRVLARDGTAAVRSSNFRVSTEDGMDSYPAAALDVTIVVSDRCRVTFETNGGSAVEPQLVTRGTPLAEPQPPRRAGYAFLGWYSDFDLTRPWDLSAPVTADMTLYAAWEPADQPSRQTTVWPAVLILLAAPVLAVCNTRRRAK